MWTAKSTARTGALLTIAWLAAVGCSSLLDFDDVNFSARPKIVDGGSNDATQPVDASADGNAGEGDAARAESSTEMLPRQT